MNPTDQIRSIAEFDGWRRGPERWISPTEYQRRRLPKYLISLDAIVSVTKKLSEGQKTEYLEHLCELTVPERRKTPAKDSDLLLVVNATAGQRAEALLRTIGKWRDE